MEENIKSIKKLEDKNRSLIGKINDFDKNKYDLKYENKILKEKIKELEKFN